MSLETREKLIRFALDVIRYAIATALGYWGGTSQPAQIFVNNIINSLIA